MNQNPLRVRLNRLTNALAAKVAFVAASAVVFAAVVLIGASAGAKALVITLVLCDVVVVTEIVSDLQRVKRSA